MPSNIHCRHCGTDNQVDPDVIGTTCAGCSRSIFSPEFEAEIAAKPMTLRATIDRTEDAFRVLCPHCGFTNEFLESDRVYIFRCHKCDQPIEAIEAVQ